MTTLPVNIPEYFKTFRSTIKETSLPDDKKVFIDSEIEAIDFDKVKNDINKNLKSNDALIINQNNKWIFIEFKSGFIRDDVERECMIKIYDTILLSIDIAFNNSIEYIKENPLQFFKQNCDYYLVYGSKNEPFNESYMTTGTRKYLNNIGYFEKNKSKKAIAHRLAQKANDNYILFGLHKFKGYLFKNVYTIDEDAFKKKFHIE
ncbi:MAG: hypothetical protein UH241_02615 [Acutalibacteraceae bacterium]|nr:hypothetical protein [Acutalibacteraceae bacterium]